MAFSHRPEDQQAITRLLYRYARAVDTRNVEALAACFYQGRVTFIDTPVAVESAHHCVEILASMFDWTMHNVFNHLFEVEGDQATGVTYCVASHVKTEEGVSVKHDWYLQYHDTLVRAGDDWVFQSRRLQVDYISTVPVVAAGR